METLLTSIAGEIIAGAILTALIIGGGFFYKFYRKVNDLSKCFEKEKTTSTNTHKRLEKADKTNKRILFMLGDLIVNGISKEEKAKRLKMIKDLTEE